VKIRERGRHRKSHEKAYKTRGGADKVLRRRAEKLSKRKAPSGVSSRALACAGVRREGKCGGWKLVADAMPPPTPPGQHCQLGNEFTSHVMSLLPAAAVALPPSAPSAPPPPGQLGDELIWRGMWCVMWCVTSRVISRESADSGALL
jgi:hypothetical protein